MSWFSATADGEIVAEWLFDDHASPFAVLFFGKLGVAELLYDDGEKSRAGGQIEKAIALRVLLFFHLRQQSLRVSCKVRDP